MHIKGVNPFVFQLGHWLVLAGVLTLVGLLVLAGPGFVWAAPAEQSSAEGEALFKEKCVACHTIGNGKLVGPDLQDVTNRQSRDWLARWIKGPDKVLAEGDPIATQLFQEFNNIPMPNLGLTDAQVASLLAYLESQAGGAAAPQPAPAALPAGDAAAGHALFTGSIRFQNGGPPCMGCHSTAGIGALGGGALGPDLTLVFNKYNGEAGLAAFLAGVPTPTMNAVWAKQPPTPQERANLIAFLQTTAVSQRPPQALVQLALLAILGLAVLLGLAQLTWWQRLTEVRRPILRRSALRQQ